jgi:hypothetical protein
VRCPEQAANGEDRIDEKLACGAMGGITRGLIDPEAVQGYALPVVYPMGGIEGSE